jgi:hypothetical protein
MSLENFLMRRSVPVQMGRRKPIQDVCRRRFSGKNEQAISVVGGG